MKKITLLFTIISFAIASQLPSAAQKVSFNGIWTLDRSKSVLVEDSPALIKIDVKIKGDSLLTERTYVGGDGQEYPFTENVTLDGRVYNITIYDMPRKTKATWSDQDGTITVESTTTYTGDSGQENFISKESWKADNVNKTLTINFKNNVSEGEVTGVFLFTKSE
jgi:hypothetical protein